MRYIPDWQRIRERFLEFWARENHDRPLLSIQAPKKDRVAVPPSHHATLQDRWLDTQYVIDQAHAAFENTCFMGEAVANLFPNLGPDIFAALYGTPLVFGETTSWSIHTLESPDDWPKVKLDRQGFYYRKLVDMTRDIAADAKDQYLVGVTDIHAGPDALMAMRGPQALCCDALEEPEWVRQASIDLFDGFCTVYDELAAIAQAGQEGTINWMGVWHPERWYVTSCDFCCMISPAMFEELVIPELMMELAHLDASIFHLDGPDALRHLDRLLEIPQLKGIQWVYGAGQPTASHWIAVLRQIQDAGKCVHVDVTPQDLPILLEELPPEGMFYQVHARDEDEAAALLSLAERHPKRLF